MPDQTQTLEAQLLAARDNPEVLTRLDALLELAEHLIRRNNHRALELAREAQALAVTLDDNISTPRLARSQFLAGTAQRYLIEHEAAQQNLNAALSCFEVLGDQASQARCLTVLATIEMEEGQLARALEQFLTALSLFQASGDKHREGGGLMNIGVVYKRLGDYAAALDYYLQALWLCETHNQAIGKDNALAFTGIVSNNIGDTLGRLERWEESLEHSERALQITRQVGDKQIEGGALLNLGEACYKLQL